MDIISVPLGWVMKFIYEFVGNYGVSLILFTLFTKVILLPLTIRQKKSQIKQNVFQPMINDINKKYAQDSQKRAEEIQKLQTEHGFSLTAGCLPLLIQMPILIGLIDVIYNPLKHIMGVKEATIETLAPIAEKIVEISRYSAESSYIAAIQKSPEAFTTVLDAQTIQNIQNFNLTFMGLDLTAIPQLAFDILLIIPVLSVGLMLLNQVIMMKLNGQKLQGALLMTPLISASMFLYFSFSMPVGVSLYWIFSSFFGIVQELLLRLFIDFDKEKAKIQQEIDLKKEELRNQRKNAPKKSAAAKEKQRKEDDDNLSPQEQDEAAKRLARARALDKEKYGE